MGGLGGLWMEVGQGVAHNQIEVISKPFISFSLEKIVLLENLLKVAGLQICFIKFGYFLADG